jgi:hypothetical protein
MNKYIATILILFFQFCNFCKSQVDTNVDSVDFYKFYSPSVFLHAPTDKLLNFMGKPDSFSFKKNIACPPKWTKSVDFISLFYKNENLIYLDFDGYSLLHAIEIKKHDYSLYYEKFCFENQTSMEDVIKYFKVPQDRIDTIGFADADPIEYPEWYQIILSDPFFLDFCRDEIILQFDREGFLLRMNFCIFRLPNKKE